LGRVEGGDDGEVAGKAPGPVDIDEGLPERIREEAEGEELLKIFTLVN
jgi:hypothetical protein